MHQQTEKHLAIMTNEERRNENKITDERWDITPDFTEIKG